MGLERIQFLPIIEDNNPGEQTI